MNKTKILVGFIALLCVLFVVSEFKDINWLSDVARGFIVPTIAVLFVINYGLNRCSFTIFLILFSLAELISISQLIPFLSNNMPYAVFYYLCNGLYGIAYSFLVYRIIKSLNIKLVLKGFFVHLMVLLLLNGYLLYVLFNIMSPYLVNFGEKFIELFYTVAILLVLSTSLINFLYKDTKKSLYLFLGSLSIVFSEVIQIAYLYISKKDLLDIFYTSLLVIAFYLFYKQVALSEEDSSILSGNEVFK